MGRELSISPSSSLQSAHDAMQTGDTLILDDGTWHESLHIVKPGITIKARHAGLAIIDARGGHDGIWVDHADNVTIEGVRVNGAARAGIYGAQCNNLRLTNCFCHSNGVQGILTGKCSNLHVVGCQCFDNRDQHGIYVSGPCVNPYVKGNHCFRNGGCGVQLNGLDAATDHISNAKVEDNECTDNGATRGGAALNFIAVRNSEFTGNRYHDNLAGGMNLSSGSTRNNIARNVGDQPATSGNCLHATGGSTGNTYAGNVYTYLKPKVAAVAADSTSELIDGGNNIINGVGASQ